MDKILKFLIKYCNFLYHDYDFKFVDSSTSKSLGGEGCLVLSNEKVKLKFINDRQQLFLDFSSAYDKSEDWYSFDLVRQLINPNDIDFSIMNRSNAIFLENNFDKILLFFSKKNFNTIKEKLEQLKDERAERLFGK